jgi:hypothetical protein
VDIAVNLVESYLRLTGYLTLSEFEVQHRDPNGRYKSVTDIDVMAVRMPGATYIGDPHGAQDCALVQLSDPVLGLEADTIDVIIGEVKQGVAELNPGIKDHAVLHAMTRRVEWLYEEPIEAVIEGLQRHDVHRSPAKGGARIRTRLVAFGRSPVSTETVISLSHVVSTMLGFFETFAEAFQPVQFREPAPAFLRLLLKSGFEVDHDGHLRPQPPIPG